MTTAIDSELATDIAEALEVTGVRLTVDQVRELLQGEDELVDDLEESGVDDTELRGQLSNVLSLYLLGEPWPTYGDVAAGMDNDAFLRRLAQAAAERGFEIVSE
ncbi:hypothetical protein RHOFW510R12_00890 [Rhodanobacter sp. FW510-R12]|uniref:hypothetical protein n=1 Tax=Rhodanobacter thiooxydans TaxID=416169 RepID=UPI0009242ECB|nr:hypothetical protein [Rhodanobacter thiooxydans]UJJ56797.1 hypothetical protein LRK53_18450 [Rhodanobacter thiooxydans]